MLFLKASFFEAPCRMDFYLKSRVWALVIIMMCTHVSGESPQETVLHVPSWLLNSGVELQHLARSSKEIGSLMLSGGFNR